MRYAVEIKGDYLPPCLEHVYCRCEAQYDWHAPRDRPDIWTFDDYETAWDMAEKLGRYSYWTPAFEDGSMEWAVRGIRE